MTIDSPVSPVPSILALLFVILLTMIKQGYEDFLRHRADKAINHKLVTKIEPDKISEIQSQNVQVGDILCVQDGEEFPCDMLLLSSSNPKGKVTIMTANLDGETNLKTHTATHLTRSLTQPDALTRLQASVDCENPNPDLHRFVGRLKVFNASNRRFEMTSIGLENMAFRGSKLKNTEFAYGAAVYTGSDSKMSQNSKMKSNKFSSIEISMNKYLIFFLLLQIIFIAFSTTMAFTTGLDRAAEKEDVPWYLNDDPLPLNFHNVYQDVSSFVVLYNYMIPISLYVTLELQKFFGSLFLVWDLQLYDEATDQPAKCNSSDLNEELGLVSSFLCLHLTFFLQDIFCALNPAAFFSSNIKNLKWKLRTWD